MNNEETMLDPQYNMEPSEKNGMFATGNQPQKTNWSEKAAYAAGGAVFGAGATIAGQTLAAKPEEVAVEAETPATVDEATTEAQTEMPKPEDSPAPEESIVATATGVRVAQVDDDASFAEAFADARAQVGPGGVFEWHGRVYGTYYKDEWEQMTPAQRSQYQASIDYKDVMSDESVAKHHHYTTQHTPAHRVDEGTESYVNNNHETETSSEEVEVRVLQVGQTDLNQDGVPENAALLEVGGQEALIVDIDQNGTADALIADVNCDGQVEVIDITSEHLGMPNMDGGNIYASQDYMGTDNGDAQIPFLDV